MRDRHVIVDPMVLAVPIDPADHAAYLDNLLDWLTCLATHREWCSVPRGALHALMDTGRYPSRDAIGRVIRAAGDPSIGLVDVLNRVRILSETEPYLEHHTGFRDCVEESVQIDPVGLLHRCPSQVDAALRKAIAMACLAHQSGWAAKSARVATNCERGWPDSVTVSGRLSIVERESGEYLEDQSIRGKLGLLQSPNGMHDDLSLTEIWKDCELAMQRVARETLQDADRAAFDPKRIRYGRDFITSVCETGIARQPALLQQALARGVQASFGLLQNMPGAHLHPCRISAAADSPQRTRADGAKLWRCMVTRTKAGYRLHYWSLPSGGIELDAVMKESEVG